VDSTGEEKQILLLRNVCAYLTRRLMGDPCACGGGKNFSIENSPYALILMGDWCGPKSDTDRLKTEAHNPRRSNLDELIQREKKKKLFFAGMSVPT